MIAVKIGGNADEIMEEMSRTVEGNLVSFSKLDQEKDMVRLRQVRNTAKCQELKVSDLAAGSPSDGINQKNLCVFELM